MDPSGRLIREVNGVSGTSAAWSPDGRWLAISNLESAGSVEVLTRSGEPVWCRSEHSGTVWDVAWSPDGRWLASYGGDGTTITWDSRTGVIRTRFTDVADIGRCAWNPGSSHVARSGGRFVVIFDAGSGETVLRWDLGGSLLGGSLWSVAWSTHGEVVAAGMSSGAIKIRNVRGEDSAEIGEHAKSVRRLSWSPDDTLLASASADESVRIWDVDKSSCRTICSGHSGEVESVRWSPDGTHVVSASSDGTIRIWQVSTGIEVFRFEHGKVVEDAAISPDGEVLAAIGSGSLRLFDVADLIEPAARSVAVPSDYISRQLRTVGREAVRRAAPRWVPHLPAAEGRCLGVIDSPALELVFLPDGRRIVTGHEYLRCRDLETGAVLWERKQEEYYVWGLACAPRTLRLAVMFRSGTLEICRFDGFVEKTISAHEGRSGYVCWSPDEHLLASAGWDDQSVRVWDAATGQNLGEYRADESLYCISWSPDGRILAAGGDRSVHILNNSLYLLQRLEGHSGSVYDVSWLPHSSGLLSASTDGTVRRWDLSSRTASVVDSDLGEVLRVRVRQGSSLIAASNEGSVWVWDLNTGERVAEFGGGGSALDWSSDGSFLVSGEYSGKTHIWDTRDLLAEDNSGLPNDPVPAALQPLPTALAQLLRGDLTPPLSLVADLLSLTAGGTANSPALAELTTHPRLRDLVMLRWPAGARLGLVSLLIHRIPLEEWDPPEEMVPAAVRDALRTALAASGSTAPEPGFVPSALIRQALDAVDARVLALLTMLGPEAVAADPGLILRLLPQAKKLVLPPDRQRQLLGVRLPLFVSGNSHGSGGGDERGGVDLKGNWNSLLMSEWALPEEVRAYKHFRGELLYRGRVGAEPPRLRPVVLLLDISPAVYGPVEQVTRMAAYWVARSVRQRGARVVLVTSGGRESIRELAEPADLVEVWTARTLEGAKAGRSLRVARALREEAGEEAVVLVLSHAWYGSDEEQPLPKVRGLRGLFVQYPGHEVRPVIAEQCERWESMSAGQMESAAARLGRLLV